MKIAVSVQGTTLDDPVEERFGRTARFILYDLNDGTYKVLDNKQVFNAPQGAGIQAAQNVINAGADVVITGHVGPKAFKVLKATNVPVHLAHKLTVQEAITSYQAGTLEVAETNDVEDHWV